MSVATAPTDPETASRPVALTGRARTMAFATIGMGMLLAALDGTIVSTALPTIVGDLGGGNHVSWVVTSYLLAQTAVTAIVGKFGDQFGRKLLFQLSVTVFILGSALCGLSEGMVWLIASRAVQGIGAGGLTVTATALIADIIPLRERGKFQGALGAVFGVATVIGPLLGGVLTDSASWRWCFYVNVPLAAVVIVAARFTIPHIPGGARHRIDYAGMATVALGASMLVLATSLGGTTYGWGSWQIVGLIVGGLAVLAVFVLIERRATEPILPMRLFRSRVFADCCALSFVVGFTMLGAMTFLPTFFQYVEGVSATDSGMRMLPLVLGLLLTAILSGNIVSKTGRYKVFPVVGSLVMAVGLALLSRMDASTPLALSSLYLFVLGLGIGLSMQVLTIIVQGSVPYAELGVATSGVTFFRTMGSAFGAAIFGTLYANFLSDRLPAAIAKSPGVTSAELATPSALHRLKDSVIAPIVDAYADALSQVFLWAAPVALVAFVLALLLPQVHLVDSLAHGASDLGSGFGAPEALPSEELLSRRIARLLHGREGDRVLEVLEAGTPDLDAAGIWALVQIYGLTSSRRTADIARIAGSRSLPPAVLEPVFRRVADQGFIEGDLHDLVLSARGLRAVGRLRDDLAEWILAHLEGMDDQTPEGVRQAVASVAQRIVVERSEHEPSPPRAAAGADHRVGGPASG
ncbi:MDR family MFS transporter [Nocardioides sp. cx-173]|uniref:MDR family MFS transporter n=1 Tax=Nocardioides sp. cx-173 TaxID=2898796 RepID=UPI001E56381B|nr:MDR family MFS transporter [Nocardioides sp. cx-173]MCD4525770.1 MFS transporter [Nocardioides sp. cx-173]UGB39929.1 MFS transporter [Nocardioides sp. cx-173]